MRKRPGIAPASLAGLLALSGCALLSPKLLDTNKCAGAREGGGSYTTAELVAQGNVYLASTSPFGSPLDRAASCYLRARQLSSEDYSVNLGLGVTYLIQAKAKLEAGKQARAEILLESAKKALGIAYIVRQGHLEPIYYLAEIAILENKPDSLRLAQLLLQHLEKERYKLGSVATLQGYLAERGGDRMKARERYLVAIRQNWPPESVNYALERYLAKEK